MLNFRVIANTYTVFILRPTSYLVVAIRIVRSMQLPFRARKCLAFAPTHAILATHLAKLGAVYEARALPHLSKLFRGTCFVDDHRRKEDSIQGVTCAHSERDS